MTESLSPVRRVVTGHDADGRAVIALDGPPSTSVAIEVVPGTVFHELWATATVPAQIDSGGDPTLGALQLAPPVGGTRIRIVDIPPDSVQNALTPEQAAAAFAAIGASHAHGLDGPHALMHRTETVDYGIVLSGEVWLVVDDRRDAARAGRRRGAARDEPRVVESHRGDGAHGVRPRRRAVRRRASTTDGGVT